MVRVVLGLIQPLLASIDNGVFFRTSFRWLYALLAGVSLLLAVVLTCGSAGNVVRGHGLLHCSGGQLFFLFLACGIFALCGWYGWKLWLDRRDKLSVVMAKEDDFFAVAAVAHLLQTVGEWVGMWVGLAGSLTAYFRKLLIGGDEVWYFVSWPHLPDFGRGPDDWWAIALYPLWGFLILLAARVASELLRVLVAIARNTHKA